MSEHREERRVVTALFADIVGSTPLGERLDPEELKLVLQGAITRIIGSVEAFGGTVKDLAGDGVLALFGAPAAHEDDPERAIRAGLRIIEDIGAYGREVERAWGIEGFSVRVGINTGLVVVGVAGAGGRVEYTALGDAINTAARLQAAASPGSVLVGADTQRLAAYAFTWADPVQLQLKGKAELFTAVEVLGVSAAPSRTRGFEGAAQAPMIGRERELAAGASVVEGALAGSGGVVFVTGEPGVGKTRLLGELRASFEDGPSARGRPRWLEGRCVSYGESMPYWPLRDLLRSWLGVLADEPELRVRVALRRRVDDLFGAGAADIYPYLGALLALSLEPDIEARVAELSPEALQYRTFEVVRTLASRLAEDGPVALAIEDLHWADATSLQLLQQLAADTEAEALLLVMTSRQERDHGAWRLKEEVSRELPHRVQELALDPLSGNADRELLHALVGADTLPAGAERKILALAEGNPFFLEEIVRSLADAGALVHDDRGGWRFDHEVPVEIPPTVEKVILARIDRLDDAQHEALMAASVLGRQFGLPLLEGVTDREPEELRTALTGLQRLDLVREGRRWPEPEFRFKHALIQDAAYRTLVREERNRLHRKAAEWLGRQYAGREDEVAGLLAHHWLDADDEERAAVYLTRAGDRARQEYALDEAIAHYRELLPILERRGERRAIALVLFKLALALHMTLRFAEANETYQRAFDHWDQPSPSSASDRAGAMIRIGCSFLPRDPDPSSAIAWPDIQLCMHLFDRLVEAWPERTIVPSLAERWEISDDGLRYLFHLRAGLSWSDGRPLTAHDVEFGIKRVLNPEAPGSSVAIYFVLEHGQDFYLRRTDEAPAIGVRALDDRTVEFRLAAPAPYFMSVMNRPDGGPQPRHAIEAAGDAWTADQVVSGAFRIAARDVDSLVLERRRGESPRTGNVGRVEYHRQSAQASLGAYARDELEMIAVRYTPRLADLMPGSAPDASMGPAAWSGYLSFDHSHPDTSKLDLRRALALAVDRERLAAYLPVNMIVATGGVVPPALQGHTPDIALRFEPDRAREHLARAGPTGALRVGVLEENQPLVAAVVESWRETLSLDVEIYPWTMSEVRKLRRPWDAAPIVMTGWLPGYADPEYFLRLLFQSDSRTNEGGFSHAPFDEIIERARQERSDRGRLELFHEADRMVVADRVACIPLVYARSMAVVKPWVHGWWEFGKTSANYADLEVAPLALGVRASEDAGVASPSGAVGRDPDELG